jgi:hypothetical protein
MLTPPDGVREHRAHADSGALCSEMTLSRLILGCTLGMLITGLSVYTLTSPPKRKEAPQTPPTSSEPAEDSGDTDGARASDPPEDSDPTNQETFDAGEVVSDASPEDASPADASPQDEPAPKRKAKASTAGPQPVDPNNHICHVPLSDQVFNHLWNNVPALRLLPPDQVKLMRYGTGRCPCRVGAAGDVKCANWCRSWPKRSYQGGGCRPDNLCGCH